MEAGMAPADMCSPDTTQPVCTHNTATQWCKGRQHEHLPNSMSLMPMKLSSRSSTFAAALTCHAESDWTYARDKETIINTIMHTMTPHTQTNTPKLTPSHWHPHTGTLTLAPSH